MIAVLAAALIVLAASDPLTTRIEDSAAAVQALQGRLDGAWTLRDGAGRCLFVFEMSDPPGSVAPAQGAWRDGSDRIGDAEFLAETPHHLRVTVEDGAPTSFVLIERRLGRWQGVFPGHGAVTLTRGLATPRPPV